MKSIALFLSLFFTTALTTNASINDAPPISFDCYYLAILKAGTLVNCELNESFESDDAVIGKELSFKVMADVRVDNRVVIKTGAKATGRVKNITASNSYNHPVKVTIELTYVQSVDGNFIALNNSEQTLKGKFPGQGMTVHIGAKISGYVTNETEIRVGQ